MQWKYSVNYRTDLNDLASVYARGRWNIRWTEEYVHRMPQSWYVWADDGRVTCDCVVAYPKLFTLLKQIENQASVTIHGNYTFPKTLYMMDALLYDQVLKAPNLCFRPKPLW